jgi:hypothetical protein
MAQLQASTVAGILTTTGNVGIGTTNPGAPLHVNDSSADAVVRISKGASTIGNIDLVNEGNRFSIQDDGTRRLSIDVTGNVGINSASPIQKLDIVGKMRITDDVILAQTNGRIDYDNGVTGALRFFSTSTSAERMRITSAGNVGIGTTDPQARLHIGNNTSTYGPTIFLDGTFESSASVGHSRIYFNDANFGIGAGKWGPGTDDDLYIWSFNGGGRDIRFAFTTDGFQPVTASAWTTKMIIKSEGSVGIGTITPVSYFQVYDNADVWHARIGGGSGELRIGGQTNSGAVIQAYTPAGVVRDLYLQRDGGNVGIGTNNPAYKLDVRGAFGTNPGIYVSGSTYGILGVSKGISNASAGVNYYEGSTQKWFTGVYENSENYGFYSVGYAGFPMVINYSTGNVGIGTTTPVGLLNVYSTGTTFTSPDITNVPVISILNGSNASVNAHAILSLRTGGSSGGDPFVSFDVRNEAGWSFGMDNSDSNKMKLNPAWNSLTTNTKLTITANGSLLLSGSVVPAESAWKGTAVFGQDGFDKVIIGTLISNYTGATIGGHPSALDAWDDLNIVGGNLIFRANETEYMRMNTSGNFGIGTATPLNKLHVQGGSGDDIIARFATSGTGTNDYSEIHIANNADDRLIFGSIGSNYTTVDWAGARYVYNTSGKLYLKSVDELQLFSGGTALANITMTLTRGGNVGIGTTTPSIYTKLHVQDKKILITSTSNNWGQLQVANTSDGESTIAVAAGGSGAVGNDSTYTRQWIHGINPFGVGTSRYSFTTKYREGTTPALMMEEDAGGNVGLNPYGGNVGVNTISPTANLHVDSGTTGATAYPLRVDASSLDYALYVSASGNVAIGGLVPAAALNHKLVVFSGSIALRGPNEAAYSYRLNDTAGVNRNALYVSSSNYLNVGNIAFTGIELFHTGSFDTRYQPVTAFNDTRIYGNITDDQLLGIPDKWLAVRVGGANFVLPMYQV